MTAADEPSVTIASTGLSATISTVGAQLLDLSDAHGASLLWDGDPKVWAGRAPVLFPIVGALEGGRYSLDGQSHAMARHGIARYAPFETVLLQADRATLRLEADKRTRDAYPFAFRLDLTFAVVDASLRMTATVSNHDTRPMPASFGFHPAFRWPLPYGQARADHVVRFDHDEPAPIRRIDGNGLLRPDSQPTPVVGDTLVLRDDLFVDDVVILDHLVSRRVRYGASAGPCLDIRFDDLPWLGLWTKPHAEFICIEPWQGIADPAGFGGDFRDKPGIVLVEPGASQSYTMTIRLDETGSALRA